MEYSDAVCGSRLKLILYQEPQHKVTESQPHSRRAFTPSQEFKKLAHYPSPARQDETAVCWELQHAPSIKDLEHL
jgi:hypothetical protein